MVYKMSDSPSRKKQQPAKNSAGFRIVLACKTLQPHLKTYSLKTNQALIGTNLSGVLWAYAVQLTTPLTATELSLSAPGVNIGGAQSLEVGQVVVLRVFACKPLTISSKCPKHSGLAIICSDQWFVNN